MSITIKKSKITYEDLYVDSDGTGSEAQIPKSDGSYRSGKKINASHIPITATARAKKQASGSAIGTTDVDATLIQVLDDLEDLGQPDDSTLQVATGVLKIKDSGVSTAKIANLAVSNGKLATDAVQGSGSGATGTNVIKAKSIAAAQIDDGTITVDKMAANSIDSDQYVDGSIDTAHIADDAVTIAKLSMDGAGTAPAAYIRAKGTATCTAGTTTAVATSAVNTGDLVMISMMTNGTAYVPKQTAISDGVSFTVTFTGSMVGTETFAWLVIKATA